MISARSLFAAAALCVLALALAAGPVAAAERGSLPKLATQNPPHEMQDARRALTDLLVPIGVELAPDHGSALDLIGAQYALANGFAVLAVRRAYETRGEGPEQVAARARNATLAMIAGWLR